MKKIVSILFIIFLFLQFFQIEKNNPVVNRGVDFLETKKTPQPIANTIKAACYDCHSNETKYPWYSYIQPIGWMLKDHIDDGRKELNFSEFATYTPKRQAHKMEEAAGLIEHQAMPLESYLIMHPEAKLNDEQRQELIRYFQKIENDIKINNAL